MKVRVLLSSSKFGRLPTHGGAVLTSSGRKSNDQTLPIGRIRNP